MHDPRIEIIDPVVLLCWWKQDHADVLYPGFQRAFDLIAVMELELIFSADSFALQTRRTMRYANNTHPSGRAKRSMSSFSSSALPRPNENTTTKIPNDRDARKARRLPVIAWL